MVSRLRISPADGIKMSPPGIDVNGTGRKLLDPRFTNLQLHQRDSGLITTDTFRGQYHWEWTQFINFPALPGVPIVFVNTKFAGQTYVDFPASMIPASSIDTGNSTTSFPNYMKVTSSTLEIVVVTASPAAGGSYPSYRYEIYKNLRESS